MRHVIAAGIVAALAGGAAAAELRGPEAFAGMTDERARAVAMFEEMGRVLQHPRCVNCHPAGNGPLQGESMAPHQPPVLRGDGGMGVPGMLCSTCHGPENTAFVGAQGSIPGHEVWHLAPVEMAWQGRSVGEICAQIKDPGRNGGRTLAELHEHNAHDDLVGWAWRPGDGREPAPGDQATFGALTQAWIAAGAHCPEP